MNPWPKQCGCGASITAGDWLRLPLVGTTDEHPDDAAHTTEMRNCRCGSTLGILVSDRPTALAVAGDCP